MSDIIVVENDILISVDIAIHQGLRCICVGFENGLFKYKNIEVFDDEKKIIENFRHFIGNSVRVTGGEPKNEQGKWSNNSWFKDIILISEINKYPHLIDKGNCKICGVMDNLLSYSEDFGNTWMHYSCKFPDFK